MQVHGDIWGGKEQKGWMNPGLSAVQHWRNPGMMSFPSADTAIMLDSLTDRCD